MRESRKVIRVHMLQPSPPRQSMNDRLIEKSKKLVVRPSIYMRTGTHLNDSRKGTQSIRYQTS